MSSKYEKELVREAIEIHAMEADRKSYEDEPFGIEANAHWMTEKMAQRFRYFDDKTVYDAFSSGLTKAYRGKLPQSNLQIVMTKTSDQIAMLRLSLGGKPLKLSIKELINKHFRAWVRDMPEIQIWINKKEIFSRSVLAASGEHLLGHFDVFDKKFKMMRPEYEKLIQDEMRLMAEEEVITKKASIIS